MVKNYVTIPMSHSWERIPSFAPWVTHRIELVSFNARKTPNSINSIKPANSRFQCKSHGLTSTQANLTGCQLQGVNIYKYYSNGVSDANFLPQQAKNAAWCWKRSPILHVHDTKLCIHKLCKRHRLVLMCFLTQNRRSSCSGCGFEQFHWNHTHQITPSQGFWSS